MTSDPDPQLSPKRSFPALRFTEAESLAANKSWKASCGPHSIAAATGRTLDDVRGWLENYKGWMNPTQISKALLRSRNGFICTSGLKTDILCDGINRVQWIGPWLDPGKPAAAAYPYTHYVAHYNGMVLCTACVSHEWIPVDDWRAQLAENECPFHITHHWSMGNPSEPWHC